MMELYEIIVPAAKGQRVGRVRRASDGKVRDTILTRLVPHGDTGYYRPRSKAAALRLENQTWETEAK